MRLARTIPGAEPARTVAAGSTFPASLRTGEFDADRIVNAAESELTHLAERDEAERADAADRAHAQLGAEAVLFGTVMTLAHTSARRAQ